METLYRKISVTNEKPLDKTPLFLVEITGAKNQNFPEDDNDWQFYLEEIPDPTAQLKADKEELLSILKGLVSDVGNLIGEHDIEWQQAGYFESAKELIQKHKK